MVKRTKVVLELGRLSVPEKIEKARFIVLSMTGNANFPSPVPPLGDITAITNALEAAALAAEGGGEDETAIMHEKESYLDRALTNEGMYVEVIANDTPAEAESIILGAGMKSKKVPVHTAREFQVANTKIPGQVKMRTKFFPRSSFIWQYRVTTATAWLTAATTVKATFVLSGLSSAVRYSFRVAVVTKNGQGPWSNVLELVVM